MIALTASQRETPRRRLSAVTAVAVLAASALVFSPPADAQTQPFSDTAGDAYYSDAVDALADGGVFDGTECAEAMLCPGKPIDRKTMAVWTVRALDGQDPAEVSSTRFTDVDADSFFAPFIERMAELGVTSGCGDGTKFCADGTVTRAPMAVFLTRAFDLGPGPDPGFSDVADDAWYYNEVAALAASGITAGCGDGTTFCPNQHTTRAQMATLLYRALELQEAQPEFITEENDFSRWVKHDLIDKYGDKWPWLKEVWDYTNREDFEYLIQDRGSSFRTLLPEQTGDTLYSNEAYNLSLPSIHIGNPSSLHILVHELAHIYTLAHGVASNPESVAIGFLYFADLIGRYCQAWEQYAETAEVLDEDFGSNRSPWYTCYRLRNTPNSEAITVVSLAFSGEIPDWFYETFQKDDDSLDYEKLWTAVKNSGTGVRTTILPMFRYSFGGYCSEQTVLDALLNNSEQQPWRDGGC